MDIKPIETYYNGYRFRSRLEARWAVFFDALGVKYEYEPEGFQLSDGSAYLPDFYLPAFNYFIEVKGKNSHLLSDLKKAERFAFEQKTALMIMSNIPYDQSSHGLYWFPIIYYEARSGGMTSRRHAFFQKYDDDNLVIQDDYARGLSSYFGYEEYGQKRFDENDYAYNAIQAINGADNDDDADDPFSIRSSFDLSSIEDALIKARQARFEHGETPIANQPIKEISKADFEAWLKNRTSNPRI